MATTSRFPGNSLTLANEQSDNTSRILTNIFLTPAYAATIAIGTPGAAKIIVQPGTLTGAVTFTAGVGTSSTPPYVGDEMYFMLVSGGTTETATFGTGFQVNGTFAVTTGKYGTIGFIFNGSYWVETARTVTA